MSVLPTRRRCGLVGVAAQQQREPRSSPSPSSLSSSSLRLSKDAEVVDESRRTKKIQVVVIDQRRHN